MIQYKAVNIIPKLDEKVFRTSASDIYDNKSCEDTVNTMLRHWLSYLNLMNEKVILTFVLTIIAIVLIFLLIIFRINLINKGLSFVPTPDIHKIEIKICL